jgi:uncharacterized protein (TIGR02145 family)
MKKQIGLCLIHLILVVFVILVYGCDTLGEKGTEATNNSDIATDADGNVYSTVTIGTQVWMKENLRTTRYSDGSAIPRVKGGSAWANIKTPAYCWYNNDSATYKNVIGAYYNWYTVNTAKLCPTGWHVPSKDELDVLKDFLGGYNVAGGKLKATGTTRFLVPNTGATNETGFTAYANGIINDAGNFFGPYVERSMLWSSTEYVYNNQGMTDKTRAYIFQLNWSNTNFDVTDFYGKSTGVGVRCLKN